MSKLFRLVLELLQRRCRHDPRYVSADIHEGRFDDIEVAWCRTCGAFQMKLENGRTDWREPRPTWISAGGWR